MIENDKLKRFLCSTSNTEIDETSSYMCSFSGSPFRKLRRTRGDRKKKDDAAKENQPIPQLNMSPINPNNHQSKFENQENKTPQGK